MSGYFLVLQTTNKFELPIGQLHYPPPDLREFADQMLW